MKILAYLIKSFTSDKAFGNPAGVVIDANDLTDRQILKLTQDLGFGESAFLQKSLVADYKIRLFSVIKEVNSCVTATLAAAFVIHQQSGKNKINFETKVGNREVFIASDGLLLIKQPPVEFSNVAIDKTRVASLLNIPENKISDYPLEVGSVGTPKLLIPIKSLGDLFFIKPNLDAIAFYCQKIGARGFYPFTLETKNQGSDFHARQFNPLDGIAEDPVTGVAAAVLAEYLKKYSIVSKKRLIGEQGYIINKPGEIIIEMSPDGIYVGGYAREFGLKKLEVK